MTWYSNFQNILWLAFGIGAPVCILPHPTDLSALEARSWGEAVGLIDEWTKYIHPRKLLDGGFEDSRKCQTSMVLSRFNSSKDSGVRFTADTHLVGGEILYWWFGRAYKFDGVRHKYAQPSASLLRTYRKNLEDMPFY